MGSLLRKIRLVWWRLFLPLKARLLQRRLNRVVDRLLAREKQTCPRRMADVGPWERKENLDYWMKRGEDRVCSFCGSMHPTDFGRFLERVIDDDSLTVRIDHSDKQYKVYLVRPEVSNASEGAIKFYKHHARQLSNEEMSRLQGVYAAAYTVSREKARRWHEQKTAEMRARWQAEKAGRGDE